MPLGGILLTVCCGMLTAAVLGIIYGYIIVYDPIIYINIACTFGFGLCIGLAVSKAVRTGKIRNPTLAGAYGLIFGFAGLYFAWVADFWARTKIGISPIAFRPDVLMAYMRIFYEKGAWSIAGNHNANPQTVKGVLLAIVWLVEAGIVVGFATVPAYRSVAGAPFCEHCNEWTKATPGAAALKYDPDIQDRLAQGDLSALDGALRSPDDEDTFTRLSLHCCPKCDSSVFLTVSSMKVRYDAKGNLKTQQKVLLRYLVVDGGVVPRILEAGQRTPPPPATTETATES
jgi:hypothetical protein